MKPKSQSKKIRDLIYRIWQVDHEGVDEEKFYFARTERIIRELKKELQEKSEPPIESYEK